MYTLDLINNDKGQLYTQKLPLQNGLFLTIKHTITNKLSVITKQINFVHLCFNKIGDRFIACDLYGNIYMFDLNYNRFMRLNRIGTSCTALAYNLKCKTEYLVATIDGTIKCFNAETKELVGWMKGHEKPIISLSVHTNGELVISFSSDIAQLWDLKTFECKQKLNINSKQNVEIIKISFASHTNDIVSAFKDDTIYVWSSELIELKCQFNLNENEMACYKCYSISYDGKLIVAAGRSSRVYIWSIETKSLYKIIDLSDKILTIKDCILLSGSYENKILLLLTNDGSIEVVNIEKSKHLFSLNLMKQLSLNEKINSISISNLNTPQYLCAITDSGFIQVYDLDISSLSKYKVTNSILKSSTINSTNLAPLIESNNNTKFVSPNLSINHMQNIKLKIKTAEKQIINKRTKTILNNDQIYTKLVNILKCYGEYPTRYRMFIWKLLLKLPENYESYGTLIEKGNHQAFIDLNKKYPIKSQKCNRLLQRMLSLLAHWAPIFAECDYLPLMVFPFVKLFQNNHVVCFEIIITFLNNWCQHWFEFFPNPPLNILNMVENLIAYHDKSLIDHFMRYRITSQVFGWSILETIFSEVFNKNEWQILFDNIFSNHPGYLIYLVAAYSICNRSSLIKLTELDDAKFFYRNQNPLSVHHLLREASRMRESTPSDINPIRLLSDFEPLVKGNYPIFNKYPKFINDYQDREKEKILKEEIDYLKERETHIESHKLTEGRKLENEFLLKKLLWNKKFNQINFKPTLKEYKQLIENYDDQQKNIQIGINVVGEPLKKTDSSGITFMNKMRKIDENFEEIELKCNINRQLSASIAGNTKLNQFNEVDFNINDVENEIMCKLNTFNNNDESLKIASMNISTNKCLNESESNCIETSASTLTSLNRGRENLEQQEKELMKRVNELRKNFALENRAVIKN